MKKNSLLFCLVMAYNVFAVSVDFYDEQQNNGSIVGMRIRVNNDSGAPITDAKLRYYFHRSSSQYAVDGYYLAGATMSVNDMNDGLAYIELDIPSIPQGYFPDLAGFSLALHHADWSPWEKDSDYSYIGASGFTENSGIVLLSGDEVVYGNTPNAFLESPDAHTGVLYSGITIMQDEGDSVPFSWQPVPGYANYRLTVLDEDSSLVYERVHSGLAANVKLSPGKYLWMAQGVSEDRAPLPNPRKLSIMNVVRKALIKEERVIGIPSRHGGKDTELLVTSWGEFADLRGWDKKHDVYHQDESSGKCWAIAIQELNHFYGGNLPLDEIVAWSHINVDDRHKKRGPSLSAFMLGEDQGGIDTLEIEFGLQWALGITPEWVRDFPSRDVIKTAIRNEKPLYFNVQVGAYGHAMIMDGYAVTKADDFYVHFLNTDNYGHNIWAKLDDSSQIIESQETYTVKSYAVIDHPVSARKTDSLVFKDSDGDGLMDFDELYRFFTNPDSADSDGDDIDDKTEIHSYTIRQQSRLNSTSLPTRLDGINKLLTDTMMADLNFFIHGIEEETYADIDGDSLRAELDADSDNDGIPDGIEDKNWNGYVDADETDPYEYDGYLESLEESIPKEITLYSLDYVWLNDGVRCTKGKSISPCNIAAEGIKGFPVILGTDVLINDIHSKGQVWLRSHSETGGIIRYYGSPEYIFTTKMQQGAKGHREFNCDERLWPWKIRTYANGKIVGFKSMIVHSGETKHLIDGDSINVLKVESGGRLIVPKGMFIVNDLQMESGSGISFESPGFESVLQVRNSLIWRAEIADDVAPDSVARGFKLAYYGNERIFIDGEWTGFLYAPNAKIVLGQSKYKVVYGQILGNGIEVHQRARVYEQKYNPVRFYIYAKR